MVNAIENGFLRPKNMTCSTALANQNNEKERTTNKPRLEVNNSFTKKREIAAIMAKTKIRHKLNICI